MSTADESDEDLKRAIAMSLAESSQLARKSKPDIIDLISSDEDDDLDAPVFSKMISTKGGKMSNAAVTDVEKSPEKSKSRMKPEPQNRREPAYNANIPSEVDIDAEIRAAEFAQPKPDSSNGSFLGLDRKQMEEERLRRAQSRKRKEPTSPLQLRGAEDRKVKAKMSNTTQPAKHQTLPMREGLSVETGSTASSLPPARSKPPEVLPFKGQEQTHNLLGVQFPDGVVKKTWVEGFPREDDIKLEEVLQKDTLDLAVLSAFQVDPQWVSDKIRPGTRVIWVLQAKTEAEKQEIQSQAPSRWRFCFPSMEGQINCMHSKLQLLAHSTHLRVVIPSANLVSYDWGETGVMENVCFLIDLPRFREGRKADMRITEFGKELLHFVQAMGLDPGVIASMNNFDFSHTAHLAFIHTIGGAHIGDSWKRTGFPGLGTAVQNLGLQTEEVAASIGSLSDSFIKSIYLSAQGDNGLKEFNWRQNRPKGKLMSPIESKLSDTLRDRFRIYFPTRETVEKSLGIGRCWHDMFPTAMGKLVKDKATKEPKLNCRNWECGVIIALPEQASASKPKGDDDSPGSGRKKVPDMEIFRGIIPVPMVVPGDEYGKKRPWFFSPE